MPLFVAGLTASAFLIFLNHPMFSRASVLTGASPHTEYLQQHLGPYRLHFNQVHYVAPGLIPFLRYPRAKFGGKASISHLPSMPVNHFYGNLSQIFDLRTFQDGENHFHT